VTQRLYISTAVFFAAVLALTAPCAMAQESVLEGQWMAVNGDVYGERIPHASLPLLRVTFSGSEARWTIPSYPQNFRYTAWGDEAPDSLDFHLPTDEPRVWVIPVRSVLRDDTLHLAFPLSGPFDPSRGTPPRRPSGAGPESAGEFIRLSFVRAEPVGPQPAALTAAEAAAADIVDARSIEQMTQALAAPEMEGRGSGQRGGERAAHVIADWFRDAGLEPLGEDGFLQPVPLFTGRAAPTSTLTIGDTTFHSGQGFAISSLLMRTRPEVSLRAEGEVFLFAPSLGVARASAPMPELDVKGRIVAWIVTAGPADGSEVDFMRTYEVLHRSGAEAIIPLFPGPLPEPVLLSPIFSGISTLDVDLYGSRAGRPVILLGPTAFGALFGDGSGIRAFVTGIAPGEHAVHATGKHVSISWDIEEATAAPTYNVAGVIRGSDPVLRDEAVVYTAHYDALGTVNGAVFPGAADNALGVAEMVEIARAIRQSGVRPRRSIIFLAVGAEERGMLGTLHWTRHPTWPIESVVANINLDGGDAEAWGPLHGVIDLTRVATLGDEAAEIAAALGYPLLPNNEPGLGSSDFYDFMRADIPAIQLMGIGGDPDLSLMRMQRFGAQRIHQPDDVIDEDWDWTGPRQMAQLYLLLGLRVADAEGTPAFRERP
jgi:hypothetical protein